jgi:hypothetical protein
MRSRKGRKTIWINTMINSVKNSEHGISSRKKTKLFLKQTQQVALSNKKV